MEITAKEIALLVMGRVEGDENVRVSSPAKIEEAQRDNISFIAHPKYARYAATTRASILLVASDFEKPEGTQATLIRVENVYAALALLLAHYENTQKPPAGIASNAYVHGTAQLAEEVSVGMFAIVEKGARVGQGAIIYPQVYIGSDVKIGNNVIIYPGVKIYHQCEIGNNCIIHANAIIGSDGFGFVPNEDGAFQKIPQIGKVILEDNVEVGANTVIDRGSMGATIIRQGVKLDNLIQIAHNVAIGEHTVIAAQAGIAGSTVIGAHCQIGGQAGFVGHIKVAEGAKVQAQSGVAGSIKKSNMAVYGSPAIPYSDYLRAYAGFKNLPELIEKIQSLERRIRELEA